MKKNILMLFCMLILLFGCVDDKGNVQNDQTITEVQQIENTSGELKSQEVPLKKANITLLDLKINSYEVDANFCGNSTMMIAPSYVTEDHIYFDYYDSERRVSWIKEMSRSSGLCKKIYEGEGIGNLTGYDSNLYFTSYDIESFNNVDWEIKEFNTETDEIRTIRNGSSMNDTEPPTVQVTYEGISWIEYITKNKIITSTLYEMNGLTKGINIIATETLDENKGRNGEYFALQQNGGSEGILLHKSIFKNETKEMEIALYMDNQNKQQMLKGNNILNFAISKEYFSYTGTGYFKAQNRKKTGSMWVYRSGNQLTFDTPIFIDEDSIIFRYSMNQLFLADLNEGVVYPVTKYEELLSKPISHNGLISYAQLSDNNKFYFSVFKVNQKN